MTRRTYVRVPGKARSVFSSLAFVGPDSEAGQRFALATGLDASQGAEPVAEHGVQTVQVPAGGGGVVDVKIDQPGLYPFVSHAFAHVDLGQVGLLKVGHPPGTMSH